MRRACRGTLAGACLPLARTSSSFGFDPRNGSNLEGENVFDVPHPVRESSGHGWSTGRSHMFGGTQFVMGHTEVVDTAAEIHTGLKRLQAMSRMATPARQGCQTLSKS